MAPEPENRSNQTDQTGFSTSFAETCHDVQIKQLILFQKGQVYDREFHAPQSTWNSLLLTLLGAMGCCMETCLLGALLKTSFLPVATVSNCRRLGIQLLC